MSQQHQSAASQQAAARAGQHDDAHGGQGQRGRVGSWLCVVLIIGGFVVGGLGLVLDVNVTMIATGAGMVVVGGLVGLFTGIMDYVH